jgi:hypothetical protein
VLGYRVKCGAGPEGFAPADADEFREFGQRIALRQIVLFAFEVSLSGGLG